MFGTLKIMVCVSIPSINRHGEESVRDKSVTLATVHCHYDEREPMLMKFVDLNRDIPRCMLFAEFVCCERVHHPDDL